MKKISSILLVLTISLFTMAQNSQVFRTIYYPANPNGGIKELERFIKQDLIYPDSLLNANVDGEVFITFLIDNKGKVKYKKVENSGHPLLQAEANRIFDRIIWEADESRDNDDLGYEKIRIDFNSKKYRKLVKKRGFHHHKYDRELKVDQSNKIYTINEVDEKPQITNAESVDALVSENFKYPSIAYERGISGRVTLEFIVEPYGMISNVAVIEDVSGGCTEETKRLISMIDWKAGIKDGEAVRTLYRYELNFMNPRGVIR